MKVVYYDVEKGEHITINHVNKIETTICVDDLEITYSEGISDKVIILEKSYITSITY